MTIPTGQQNTPNVIGLIGGTGWPSTALYYERLNRLSEPQTVDILVSSLAFGPILEAAGNGDFDYIKRRFVDAAMRLEGAGVSVIAFCAATAHMACEAVENAVSPPVLHIAAPLVRRLSAGDGNGRTGILGTRQTLELGLFSQPLRAAGHEIVAPSPHLMALLDDAIKGPISSGLEDEDAIAAVQAALDDLADRGVERVLLGCTELPLIRRRLRAKVALIDPVDLHCRALLEYGKIGF